MKNRRSTFSSAAIIFAGLAGFFCFSCQADESEAPLENSKAVHPGNSLPSPDELAKLPSNGGPGYNRLVFEKSPYLLQHARNPVNWFPWGDEAFEKARRENKPIFLSIGYSTCHWCHVMETESFEDDEVAALMNQDFVCIKVDREERPDVDHVYMTVTQAMTGSGGWPMTIVMTPDKKPFYAGTYFPKESRFGRIGMMDLLPQLAGTWKDRHQEVEQSTEKIIAYLRQTASGTPGGSLKIETLDRAYEQLVQRYDRELGGFGSGMKFPTPHNLFFLLRYWQRTGKPAALDMVVKTLREMRRGGIYDQVGYGFHRYSTDRRWLLPHFEKMLYDQALLAMAYTEAFQATGEDEFAETAREIFTYVLRDMTSPEGGFYSAEDADSEGEEGKFYVWTTDEIRSILGPEDAKIFIQVYNLKEDGNFHEQSTGRETGSNIPHLQQSTEELADDLKMPNGTFLERREAMRRRLFESREKRIHPLKDDKILTDWNGLMIAALAKSARALNQPEYAEAASRAADFILDTLRDDRGRLLKRYRQGEAGLAAHLEDYAFMVWGLLELYEANFDIRYLESAIDLNEIMVRHFWDEINGGFYLTADDGEALLVRPKEIYDGAIPSGNSVAALNLIRLGRITDNRDWARKSEEVMKAFSGDVARSPSSFTQFLCALDYALGPAYEVVITGKAGAEDTAAMLQALYSRFTPNKVVLFRPAGQPDAPIGRLAEFTKTQESLGGKATAYVCQNFACKAPTTDIAAMLLAMSPAVERIR